MKNDIILNIFARAAMRSCAKDKANSITKPTKVTITDIANTMSGSRATRYRKARKIFTQMTEVNNG